MFEIKLSLPDETLVALKRSPEELAAEVRLAAAVKLYELGRLSSGAAAALAGIPRAVFLSKLADYGVATFKNRSPAYRRPVPLDRQLAEITRPARLESAG